MAQSYIENARAIREAMDFAGATLSEENALVCVHLYRPWSVGVTYKVNEYLTYGKNSVGDPQLYQVLQDHTSSAEWTPDTATSLYKKIGISGSGYPEWVQPLGATDAYSKGDIVSYNGKLYRSLIDGNVWNPEEYSTGWEIYKE